MHGNWPSKGFPVSETAGDAFQNYSWSRNLNVYAMNFMVANGYSYGTHNGAFGTLIAQCVCPSTNDRVVGPNRDLESNR